MLDPQTYPLLSQASPYSTAKPPARVYEADIADGVVAIIALVIGFLAWDWLLPTTTTVNLPAAAGGQMSVTDFPGIAVPLFFMLALGSSFTYFALRRVRVTRAGILGAGLILVASVPFALYDTTPVQICAGLALIAGYVLWHGFAARTAISTGISALTLADLLNQGFAVPFSNLGSWFAAVRQLTRRRKRATQLVLALIGLVVALPLIAGVFALLMGADARFSSWMDHLGRAFTQVNPWNFLWHFSLGIPVAIYLFALLYGDARRHNHDKISSDKVISWGESARRIAPVAVAAPMLVLCLIYLVFFAAMGSYLFSAFEHTLPADFTYAQYARRGFFELTGVAAINLVVVSFTTLFARRRKSLPAPYLRLLGAVLSLLTLLLISTGISKMVLYIGQYGLSQLRLYTLWFMIVLFIVFGLIMVWQIHPWNVSTPVILVVVFAFLALSWANSDAIIADYNVNHYLDHSMASVDVSYLEDSLSDASVPALNRLVAQAGDSEVRLQAAQALREMAVARQSNPAPWTAWNWQSDQAGRDLPR